MDFLLFMLNVAWKVLALCMGWMLFKYVIKNGSGTFRELLDTISIMLRTFGHWIRKTCLGYLKHENESASQAKVDYEAAAASYNEYLRKRREECMTFEEFTRKMADNESFTLD